MTVECAKKKRVVLGYLQKLRNVIEPHFLYGPNDKFNKVEVCTKEDLDQQLIINDTRNIDGIGKIITCFFACYCARLS